ncbi:MAG: copper homeostasis protein CutC [Vicinamibacterales bacterium]
MVFESCIDSFDGALASVMGGAARLELCARLDVGGTTPDPALLRRIVAATAVPVVAMVRPRAGDFVFDAAELDVMAADIRTMQAAGARGIVLGVLGPDRTIAVEAMRRLVDVARPLPVTCHRAIDATADLERSLDALMALGVDRVLTSGGAVTAADGAAAIASLVRRGQAAIQVIAGGGVRATNVAALVQATGVRAVHARVIRDPGPVHASAREDWRRQIEEFVVALQSGPAQKGV